MASHEPRSAVPEPLGLTDYAGRVYLVRIAQLLQLGNVAGPVEVMCNHAKVVLVEVAGLRDL